MFAIIGMLVVLAAVIGGFLMEHGPIRVLMQPSELLIIGGAGRPLWAPTRRTRNNTLSPPCARRTLRPTWPNMRLQRTRRTGCAKKNASILVSLAASKNENRWSRCLAGSRRRRA